MTPFDDMTSFDAEGVTVVQLYYYLKDEWSRQPIPRGPAQWVEESFTLYDQPCYGHYPPWWKIWQRARFCPGYKHDIMYTASGGVYVFHDTWRIPCQSHPAKAT